MDAALCNGKQSPSNVELKAIAISSTSSRNRTNRLGEQAPTQNPAEPQQASSKEQYGAGFGRR